ncbi:hypothetical protein NIES4073_28430 [Kalymmatonema gypsitolerans NIES-4073]|nr:hypothetical protein NIES4073_28430 [Scytonema sp. NIES-4073]
MGYGNFKRSAGTQDYARILGVISQVEHSSQHDDRYAHQLHRNYTNLTLGHIISQTNTHESYQLQLKCHHTSYNLLNERA